MDLGRLTVVRQLGSGGQGKVLLATDPDGEAFAVKVLALRPGADRELILRRAAALRCDPAESALSSILSFGQISEAPVELRRQLGQVPKDAIFLVMRFVRGTTLAAAVARRPFSLREAAAAVAGIARAIGRLPEGVVHGDLRAPNIFIRPSGEIALVDPDLMREPGEADDRHALAALGRDLLAADGATTGDTTSEALARTKLAGLLADLDGLAPVAAGEAAQRSAEIAISLGAPAGDVTAVLANRGKEAEVLSEQVSVASAPLPAGRSSAAARIPLALGAVASAAILVAGAIWFSSRQPKLVPAPSTAGGEVPETVAADEIYDTTGTVHYDEPVHRLGPSEHVAAGDGMVNFKFEASIPRVALLTPREDLLWEMRTPPAGASVYLDIKPGRYFVEQDRDLGGTIQQDRQLIEIDRYHPLRVTTTKAIVNSPHRPGATPENP